MRSLLLAVACVMASPVAAQAMDQQGLDCAVAQAPEGLGDAMLQYVDAEEDFSDLVDGQFTGLVERCAAPYDLDDDKSDAYYSYSLNSLLAVALKGKLDGMGVPFQAIDYALAGESGASVQSEDDLEDEQLDILFEKLSDAGLDPYAFGDDKWLVIGEYIGAISHMRNARAALE